VVPVVDGVFATFLISRVTQARWSCLPWLHLFTLLREQTCSKCGVYGGHSHLPRCPRFPMITDLTTRHLESMAGGGKNTASHCRGADVDVDVAIQPQCLRLAAIHYICHMPSSHSNMKHATTDSRASSMVGTG
jgi:hypothetical protein